MFFVIFALGVFGLGVTKGVPLSNEDQSRIIGGVEAAHGSAPYMAALLRVDTNRFMCGGSIISDTCILTAAHCVDAFLGTHGDLIPATRVRVGSNQWNSGGKLMEVKNYYNHPDWDPINIKYDAGIFVLNERLELNDYVSIVKLKFDYVDGDVETLITGWGATGPRIENGVVHLQPTPDDLQMLHVNTLTHDQCQTQMSQVASPHWHPHIQKDIEICTFHSRGTGLCVGDSGSALLLKETREQFGLVSWGWGCAQGAPDVSVRLYSSVRVFIQTIMNKESHPQESVMSD